jgi:hypothetical protein
MSLHLLPAGPIVVTADPSLGTDAVRVIAWQPETIPALFPGEAARKRPGYPHQYLLLTNRRELARALKRSIAAVTYPAAEDVAGTSALYALVASECLKTVTALDWNAPIPSLTPAEATPDATAADRDLPLDSSGQPSA